jgi:predicted PurR-regulated permease PerM
MVSFFVLIGIILVIGALFFRVMVTFLVPLFFAAVLVVVFRPLHRRIEDRCQGRDRLAAGLTTAAIMLIVLVPAILVFTLAVVEATSLLREPDVAVVSIKLKVARLRKRMELDMPLAEEARRVELALNNLYSQQNWSAPESGDSSPAAVANVQRTKYVRNLVQSFQQQAAIEFGGDQGKLLEPVLTAINELESQPPGSLAFATQLETVMDEFRRARTELYGGSFRAWLVELANPSDEDLRQWSERALSTAQRWLLSVGGATTAFVARLGLGILIMMISVFFFLLEGPSMTQTIMRLSPLDDRYEEELLQEFSQISRAVVVATILSAVVQGFLAGIGYWAAGLDSVFLLMMLTTVMALVPFLGAASVWLPASLWLYFYDERTWAAALLAIYGTVIVSMADNVIKPIVLHGQSRLHPLLALLSVLGGIQALGPIGILVGPMVVAFLQTLLNMLHRELTTMDRDPTGRAEA